MARDSPIFSDKVSRESVFSLMELAHRIEGQLVEDKLPPLEVTEVS